MSLWERMARLYGNLSFRSTSSSYNSLVLSLIPLYLLFHKFPLCLLFSWIFNSFFFFWVPFPQLQPETILFLPVFAASSGARGLKAKFESMAEEKRKREEEEKAQQMARQQQERKALVKKSQEAQQPVATLEEPVVPAPLPKKISSEVSAWPSGIHIQSSLLRQEPKGSIFLAENKAQASSPCCSCLQEDFTLCNWASYGWEC